MTNSIELKEIKTADGASNNLDKDDRGETDSLVETGGDKGARKRRPGDPVEVKKSPSKELDPEVYTNINPIKQIGKLIFQFAVFTYTLSMKNHCMNEDIPWSQCCKVKSLSND